MILVFADDSTVQIFDTVEEANVHCEAIDVENQEYVFLDERGCVLKPIMGAPVKKKLLGLLPVVRAGPFAIQPTDERREDLVRRLESGEVKIERGTTTVRSLDDLRTQAPSLFHPRSNSSIGQQ